MTHSCVHPKIVFFFMTVIRTWVICFTFQYTGLQIPKKIWGTLIQCVIMSIILAHGTTTWSNGTKFCLFWGKKCLLSQQWGGNGGLKIRNYPLNDTIEVILGDWCDNGVEMHPNGLKYDPAIFYLYDPSICLCLDLPRNTQVLKQVCLLDLAELV